MNTNRAKSAPDLSASCRAACAEISAAFANLPGARVGIDVASVHDIEDSLRLQGQRFLDRVFAPAEQAYADSAQGELRLQRLAARFAAKEAAIKALDLGESGVRWSDLETTHDAAGQPQLRFGGSIPARVHALVPSSISVSLTHHGDCAAAVVLVISHPKP